MIDQRDEKAASLDRIEAVYGPSGWTFARRQAWLAAVSDLSVDAVERGSLDLVREFEGRIPTPATLRAFATKHQQRKRETLPTEMPVDEAALRDAQAAAQFAADCPRLMTEAELDAQVLSIVKRLKS